MSFTISSYMLDAISGASVEMLVDGVPVTVDQTIVVNQVVTLVCGAGFKFESAPYFRYTDMMSYIDYDFILSLETNEKVASGVYDGIYDSLYAGWPVINTIIDENESGDIAPLNNVYLVDPDIIETVNSERFVYLLGGESVEQVIDYGVYILSILNLPFKIDDSLVAGLNTVKLGNKTLTVSAEQLTTDKIIIDFGTISTPANSGDLLDYTNIVVNLYLPFVNPITIDANMAVGEAIGIEYTIDVYTGNAIINLSSSKIEGRVFYSSNVNLGVSVPYTTQSATTQQLFNANIAQTGNNKILKPFIEVIKNDVVLPHGFFTVPIADEGQLSAESGFVTVDNIELEVEALSIEKEMIIARLASGVIIK